MRFLRVFLAVLLLTLLFQWPLEVTGQEHLSTRPVQQSTRVYRIVLGAADSARVDRLDRQVDSLCCEGAFADAIPLAREMLQIYHQTQPASDDLRWWQLTNVKQLLAQVEHAASLPIEQQRELAIVNTQTLEIDSALASHGHEWDLEMARNHLEVRRRLLGEEHPGVAESLQRLADLLKASRADAPVDSLYNEVLLMRRKLLGEHHPLVANTLNNLAGYFYQQGEFARAEQYFREAFVIYQQCVGDVHKDVSSVLANMGMALARQGDYALAEPLYRKALALDVMLRGEEHPMVALRLHNLGGLLEDYGDPAGAEPLYRQALAMRRKLLGNEHLDIASSLNSLAGALMYQGHYEEAEALLRESLDMHRALLGDEHIRIAVSLNNLAMLLRKKGDLDAAEPLYQDVLARLRAEIGERHPLIATSLINLAKVWAQRGDFADADSLYRYALAMRQELLGPDHPDLGRHLHVLGNLAWARGNLAEAESLLTEATVVYEAARSRAASGLSRATFLESPYAGLAATRLLQKEEDEVWEACERGQSRVLAEMLWATQARVLTPADAAQQDALREALGEAERLVQTYNELAREDSTTTDVDTRAEDARRCLLELEAQWSALEQELARRYPIAEGQSSSLEQVQDALDSKTALIGWLDVLEETSSQYYSWGYVIRRQGPVFWVRLREPDGSEGSNPFDDAQAWRETLADPRNGIDTVRQTARDLAVARFQPLEGALEGITNLIVVPSGAMQRIPLEALAGAEGDWLGERFAVTYVPSATVHAWLAERNTAHKGFEDCDSVLLLGDPPFNEAHLAAMANDQDVSVLLSSGEVADAAILRSAIAGDRDALAALPRLTGTRAEVRTLAALTPDPRVLLGAKACETEVVRLAASGELVKYGTLHLATHAIVDAASPEKSCLILSQVDLPDPLQAALNGERIYDGLLTAKEILREWDLDADLVTLSACETGLGKDVAGEGMVGFVYTFLQAGARSILVSLWKVEDLATSLLMHRFYENMWVHGKTKSGALREAKVWLRSLTYADVFREREALENALRTTGATRGASGRADAIPHEDRPYAHPFYWAGFVLYGQPD